MIRRSVLPALLMLGLLAVTGWSQAKPESKSAGAWEKYQALTRNNIFLRDRTPWRAGSSAGPETAAPRGIVLTGIVKQDAEFIAFLEDLRARTTSKARTGESVGEGRISGIAIDSLEYEKDGATTHVEIGMTLDGVAGGTMPPSKGAPVAPAAGEAVSAPAPTGGSAEADILERMRQRRQKEMSK